MGLRAGVAVVCGGVLALGPAVAWPDMFPEDELWGFAVTGRVEVRGVTRFPGHVFYVFPLRCSRALVSLDEGGQDLGLSDLEVEDGVDDLVNYGELGDGPLASWVGPNGPCPKSEVFALSREVAATVDLAGMSLAQQAAFFADDPRLFRSKFEFIGSPPYVAKGSPLREVDEVVRVLRIDADALVVVLDETTYRFVDGTEQTVKLGHTRRPPELPFRPLRPEKVAKYASSYAKWEARQPVEPPPAPRLPEGAEEEAATGGGTGGGTGGETGGETGAAVGTSGAGAVVPVVGVVEPVVPVGVVEPVAPVVTPAVAAVPAVVAAAPVVAAVREVDAVDAVDEVEVAEVPAPFVRRAWPLGVALVVGVGAALGLRRRGTRA